MNNYDEALVEFGKALGKFKRAYAEDYGCNPNYIKMLIDESNEVIIIPSLGTGYFDGKIESVYTSEN